MRQCRMQFDRKTQTSACRWRASRHRLWTPGMPAPARTRPLVGARPWFPLAAWLMA
jgi:hypothetical protein